MEALGAATWVIPEGYLPEEDPAHSREMVSHGAVCIVNTGDRDAHIEVTLLFADRGPAGPYRLTAPAERTLHARLNDLHEPEPVPRETDFSVVVRSDRPVVVQHTRLDARTPPHALMSTIAHPAAP